MGGSGKTSLAQQAGWKLLENFRDGVFFADLTMIQDPSLVISAAAQALSVHELPGKPLLDVLTEHLSRRKLLLILDNFEHVLPAGTSLVSLLQAAPQLHILVTSRERLHLTTERQFILPPLQLPDPHDALASLQENEAVGLFIERAQGVKPGFQLSRENATDVSAICCQLDGLPLAIELIVPGLHLFTPRQLIQQLTDRLRLLSSGPRDLPARQQTMRSAIAWSYNLLSEDEKKLFNRLSVFPGSFSLEAAATIYGSDGLEVNFVMESLLDKNLVNPREEATGARFWLFETLREFALEQLRANGEWEGIQHNHATYYAQFYATHRAQNYALWDLERHNLRRAFNWAIEAQDVELVFNWRNPLFAWEKQIGEGRQLIARALALFSLDYLAAREYINEFGIISQEINYNIFQYPLHCSFLAAGTGDYEGAVDFLIESDLGGVDDFGKAMYCMMLASYTLQLHDSSKATEQAKQSKDLFNALWQPNPYVVD